MNPGYGNTIPCYGHSGVFFGLFRNSSMRGSIDRLTRSNIICFDKSMNETSFYDLKQMSGVPASLSAQVSGDIGKNIVAERIAPGQLIEDEGALSKRFHVSRSVVRDAVKILVGKGLLEVRRGIGTRVRPKAFWSLLDDDVQAWSQSAPPDPDRLQKLMDVRRVFEPKAARWAAERGTEQAHSRIRDALEGMESKFKSTEHFIEADARFHQAILWSTENEFLIALEGVIFSALLASIKLTNVDPSDNAKSLPFHRDVCEAIIGRNGALAETLMEKLLQDTARRLGERQAVEGGEKDTRSSW